MRVVLAGGTGALGSALAADLSARGHEIVILTRKPRPGLRHRQIVWDGVAVEDWAWELSGAAVVNLAGELVDKRPTSANISLMTRSRVQPTSAIGRAAAMVGGVGTWIQLSTLAIYGDRGDEMLDEDAAVGTEPPQMTGVASAWEAAATAAASNVKRQVILRTGVVLQPDTPALNRLTGLARWGLGGTIGTGRQWVSWIHGDDFVAAVRHALATPELAGVVHVTSPDPVRNADLMAGLRRVTHRGVGLPAPKPLAYLGAAVLRTDPALALTGRRCVPARLLATGFEFEHPQLNPALRDLIH